MNRHLYKAAAKGTIEPFKEIAKDELGRIVTHNKHTVLHVNVESQTQNIRRGESVSIKFVEWILEKCPSLLVQVNDNGDAPLHVAAKCGHPAVVEVLIEFAKKKTKEVESGVETVRHMLGMTNEEKNTALHKAVQYNSRDVVKILMKTDPDFGYSANGSGQTPLYMAAARGSVEMVDVILENCPSAAYEGPNGKNALHAAVNKRDRDVIRLLLEKKKSWSREIDQYGWTPLHHAAYLGYDDVISMLLEFDDEFTACIFDKDRKMTALHLAASQGNILAMREIIRLCQECYDLVDHRRWNALHFGMVSIDSRSYLKQLLDDYPILINLINEKDVKGNSPLHVLAAVRGKSSYKIFPSSGKGDYQAINKQNISVEHIIHHGYPEFKKEIQELSKDVGSGRQYFKGVIFVSQKEEKKEEKKEELASLPMPYRYQVTDNYRKVRRSHLIEATLITAIAFVAAFTFPGGYKSENGIAILWRNSDFQAFVMIDTIAMILSLSVVFIHFMMSIFSNREFVGFFDAAIFFTKISMGAMAIAFVTGTYAVLSPSLV